MDDAWSATRQLSVQTRTRLQQSHLPLCLPSYIPSYLPPQLPLKLPRKLLPNIPSKFASMDHVDWQRLKTGEVNLGVRATSIHLNPFTNSIGCRPLSWLSNSMAASSLVLTVAQPLAATLYEIQSIHSHTSQLIQTTGQSCNRQTDPCP